MSKANKLLLLLLLLLIIYVSRGHPKTVESIDLDPHSSS